MKRIIVFAFFIALTTQSFSQQTDTVKVMTRKEYLSLSKGQRTVGFVLLGIGATCIAIAAPGNVSFDNLAILVVGGVAVTLISIPLFIAARRNKRKAQRAVAGLEFEKAPYLQKKFALHSYPAIDVKIKL